MIAFCKTYKLYNDNGVEKVVVQAQHRAMYGECKKKWQELMDNTRNYGAHRADNHKKMCQFGERVYLDQRAEMRADLKYEGNDHENATKRLYTVNNLMIYLVENAPKFTAEEMCRDITPATLKPCARVEYVKMDGEDLVRKQDIANLLRIISRSIQCKIDARDIRKRALKYKSNHASSSENDDSRGSDSGGGGGGGRRGRGKRIHMFRIPSGHNHTYPEGLTEQHVVA